MNKAPILEISNLIIGYREKRKAENALLESLNLTVKQSEFICILGPNGCGKSTLLRTIAGIQKPLHGATLLDGKPLNVIEPQEVAKISIALTENISMGNISVNALVSMGRYPHSNWLGILNHDDFNIIEHALEVTGISAFKDKNYMELSDGLKQKAVIARALAQDTPIMLFDEPTAFLDITSKLEIMQMLKALAHKFNKSVLLSTHDLDLALQTADTIWLITKDKKIQVDVPEDLVLNGHFENAFNREKIKYQVEKGIFTFEHTSPAKLKLIGNGSEAYWTERALDRIGISTDCKGKECGVIEIRKKGGLTLWHLIMQNMENEFGSVAELIKHLKTIKFTD